MKIAPIFPHLDHAHAQNCSVEIFPESVIIQLGRKREEKARNDRESVGLPQKQVVFLTISSSTSSTCYGTTTCLRSEITPCALVAWSSIYPALHDAYSSCHWQPERALEPKVNRKKEPTSETDC